MFPIDRNYAPKTTEGHHANLIPRAHHTKATAHESPHDVQATTLDARPSWFGAAEITTDPPLDSWLSTPTFDRLYIDTCDDVSMFTICCWQLVGTAAEHPLFQSW